MSDAAPITERDPNANRLAAARVWLHNVGNGPELWDAMAATAVLRALDGAHLNIEARGWLEKQTKRGAGNDQLHRQWATAVLRAIDGTADAVR